MGQPGKHMIILGFCSCPFDDLGVTQQPTSNNSVCKRVLSRSSTSTSLRFSINSRFFSLTCILPYSARKYSCSSQKRSPNLRKSSSYVSRPVSHSRHSRQIAPVSGSPRTRLCSHFLASSSGAADC